MHYRRQRANPQTNPETNRDSPERRAQPGDKLKRVSGYSKCVMTNIFSIVVAYYSARADVTRHAENLPVIVCGGLVFTTFLTDLTLMLLTSWLLTLRHIGECQYMFATILIYGSNVLFMLTPVGLLVLLDKSYVFLGVFLFPIIAIFGVLFRKEIQTAQHHRSTGCEELKKFFDLSASVTFLTFTGMISTIFFYFKQFAKKNGNLGVTVSECFIFLTIIFGLLCMLLTTVPPSFNQSRTRERRIISVIRTPGYVLFGLQTLTGLEVAAGFVKGFVVLALFPNFVGAVIWLRMEFFNESRGDEETGGEPEYGISMDQVDDERGRKDEPETFAVPVTSFIFTILMTVYSIYRGDQDYSLHLRSCMWLIFSAFMSSLSWMMLTLEPPKPDSLVMKVANILARFTVGLLAVAVLDVACFVILAIY